MARTTAVRKYGKAKSTRTHQLFTELPKSPPRTQGAEPDDLVGQLTEQLTSINLGDQKPNGLKDVSAATVSQQEPPPQEGVGEEEKAASIPGSLSALKEGSRVLSWDDVCPVGDQITKIAEASYAEVYRLRNARGVSIIKAMRLASPLRAQTAAQARAGLVDEAPHASSTLSGELRISQLLADIPGFVIYKECYLVKGLATPALLETHRAFHRRAKRRDPGRLQFYPSPSRYLDETLFLVVELGDAGTALEDFSLAEIEQVWDVLLHTAVALARAEELVRFEHRDLHEGNLCIRQTSAKRKRDESHDAPHHQFGYSGLDITILDYGLSRADDADADSGSPAHRAVAHDLEQDLSLFTSTHAAQCRVYRQMRSYLLRGDRCHLPPTAHTTPYAAGPDGHAVSWAAHHPYTNVLWLAYLYDYLVQHFCGDAGALRVFRRETRELWAHLDPDAPRAVLSFASAADVVRFAVEAGWVEAEQLAQGGGDASRVAIGEEEEEEEEEEDRRRELVGGTAAWRSPRALPPERREDVEPVSPLRRSPRRRQPRVLG